MRRIDFETFGSRGFTLIEVLISALIVAMIGGSLYATLTAGITLNKRIHQTFLDLDESRIVMEQFQRDFGRIVFYDFSGSFPEERSFADDGNQLAFIIDNGKQLRWVRYLWVTDQYGTIKSTKVGTTTNKNITVRNTTSTESSVTILVRDESDFLPVVDASGGITKDSREVLARRIDKEGWRIQYASSIAPQIKVEWRSEWNENFLPAAVRLNFVLSGKEAKNRSFEREYILPAGGRNEN